MVYSSLCILLFKGKVNIDNVEKNENITKIGKKYFAVNNYENKKSNRELGKKAYKGDEEIMKTAERLLNEEFAIILNISPDEVNSYIAEKMSQ